MNSKVRGTDMPVALVNGRIVLPDRVVTGQALVIEAGRIAVLADPADLGSGIERVEVDRRLDYPRSHRYPHPRRAAAYLRRAGPERPGPSSPARTCAAGPPRLLATFAPTPDLEEGLAFCRQWMEEDHDGARVLGAYLESPYINVAQKGALDASCVRAADDGSAAALAQFADILRVFMLAPELPVVRNWSRH